MRVDIARGRCLLGRWASFFVGDVEQISAKRGLDPAVPPTGRAHTFEPADAVPDKDQMPRQCGTPTIPARCAGPSLRDWRNATIRRDAA